MTIEEKRKLIAERLDNQDVATLDAIEVLLDSRQPCTYSEEGLRRLKLEIEEAEEDFEAGRVFTHEEMKKEVDSW